MAAQIALVVVLVLGADRLFASVSKPTPPPPPFQISEEFIENFEPGKIEDAMREKHGVGFEKEQ